MSWKLHANALWAMSWENLLMPYANNKGADEPAHPHCLISAFVVRWLDSITPLLTIAEISRDERGGSVVECRTPEREVRGSKPTAAVLCPWARHFTPRKYWLITQEAVAPSRHDWKIVDWDVKPQHKHKKASLCSWAGWFESILVANP